MVLGGLKGALGGKEGWDGGAVGGTESGDGGEAGEERVMSALRDGVSRVIMTGVGEGPVSVTDHLVDERGEVMVNA